MNNPEFQKDFFSLEKNEQVSLIRTLKKVTKLTWTELYADRGLKWEAISSRQKKSGDRIY